MAQTDFKKLVAYSSISHMGYVILGIAVWSASGKQYWSWAMNGAMFQMIAHGISSAAMFFLVGVIYDRAHHRNLDNFRGLYEPMPAFWIWRVVTDVAAGAADALMLPANGSMPTPMTSAATADSFLRLCSDIPRSLSSRRRVLRGSRRPGSPPARVRGLRMTLDQVRRRNR